MYLIEKDYSMFEMRKKQINLRENSQVLVNITDGILAVSCQQLKVMSPDDSPT